MIETTDTRPEPEKRKASAETERIFTDIFHQWAWGSSESVSGPGSTKERAGQFLGGLLDGIRRLGARSLLDAPCGDFNWAAPMADTVEHYIGVDIVAELIRRNRELHANERREFLHRDLIRDSLPRADVILCRDCLVHFTHAEIFAAVANFARSGATYLIASTFNGPRPNEEMFTGGWRPLNLCLPPFSFPAPLFEIDEHCLNGGGLYTDKRLSVWRLADLRPRP